MLRACVAFLLLLTGCTASDPDPPSVPDRAYVLDPAPRNDCPIGPLRDMRLKVNRLAAELEGHLPTWAPSGFGVLVAWKGRSADYAGAWWADARCREFRVWFSAGHEGPDAWTVEYDKPRACGNYIMGMGRCIGYRVAVDGGAVGVQTIGLSRPEADRLVDSIPLSPD